MYPLPLALVIPLILVVITAGVYDILWRRIPNWVSFSGIVLGFGGNIFLSHWHGFKNAALGVGLGFLVYFCLYLLRGMGAGDVKLMAAVGAFSGPGNWVAILVLTAVLGAGCAIFLILSRGALSQTLVNIWHILRELAHFRAPYKSHEKIDVRNSSALRLPHGAVIALAVIAFVGLARNFLAA
jgi:prepilin peptidase CpaA